MNQVRRSGCGWEDIIKVTLKQILHDKGLIYGVEDRD
jgi:hypothetical protein